MLVEDHALYREGLKALLIEDGVQVVGEAATGEDGLALALHAKPDVVVMDLDLPGLSGVEATARLVSEQPESRVIVLTVSSETDDVLDALLAGACGYVTKGSSMRELLAAIRGAADGATLLSPLVAAQVVERLRKHEATSRLRQVPDESLSEREVDVLRLVAQGMDNLDIAGELHLSMTTVKHYVSQILSKLGVENRIQAAVWASQNGLV